MADAAAIPFVMHGARAAISNGMPHIEEQVASIERAVAENPGLAFDLARGLIESVCRTVLTERSIPYDPADDLPKLFKSATSHLPFLPLTAGSEAEVRKSLTRTLNGLHTAIQGVCELRNRCGYASHGSDSPRPLMESVQALLAAEAADTIVGFLHRVHRQNRVLPTTPRLGYDDHQEFNEYVDGVHDRVRIFDEEFEPSRVLFELAPEPYRVYLAEFQPEKEDERNGEGEDGKAEAAT